MVKMKQVYLSTNTSLILSAMIDEYFDGDFDGGVATLISTYLLATGFPVDFLEESMDLSRGRVFGEIERLLGMGEALLAKASTEGGTH